MLPKSPVGQTYYSRQLYMYVFGVVNHHGRGGPQKKEDVTLYVWMEYQNRKDSDMISSALWHFFNHGAMPGLLHDKKKLCLFSDSCYGQNKNINLLSMSKTTKKLEKLELFKFKKRRNSFRNHGNLRAPPGVRPIQTAGLFSFSC